MRRPGSDHGNARLLWHTDLADARHSAGGHGTFGIGEVLETRVLTKAESLPERSRAFFPTVKIGDDL